MTYFPLSVWMTGRSIEKRKEKEKRTSLRQEKPACAKVRGLWKVD